MRHLFLTIGLLACCVHCPLNASDVNVPISHWVYPYLERMESARIISDPELRAYPLTRTAVARSLVIINANRNKLSAVDQQRLDQLRLEFDQELVALGEKAPARYAERHFIRWREDEHYAFFDIDFRQTFEKVTSNRDTLDERTSRTRLGGIVRGQLGGKLGFFMHAHNTLLRGTQDYAVQFDPGIGTPIGMAGDNAYSDDATAYITFSNRWMFLEFGRDQIKWGPGYRGSLMLSRENPQFELLKIQFSFKRWNYSAFHGWLHYSGDAKYLAGHRLSWRLLPWLYVSGSETVIYSNRNIEPLYVNPFMPFHVAEHHLGDKDNNAMSFDLTAFPIVGHKFYLGLFLDDFNSSKPLLKHYGNKFAFLIGHQWVDPFGLTDSELRWEYTRVEPYVYTHKDSTLIYDNYNQSIGHWLGPNADDLFIQFEHSFHKDVSAALFTERIRHGRGDMYHPHTWADGWYKKFLEGTVETDWKTGFEITDQIMRDTFITLRYNYARISNLDRQDGVSATNHEAHIRLVLNW
ncbi:hypothetical protein JW960_22650 [candidate division KSB1 bacterium]|nr:hypothetical protein [candidate division KSB1 bacterium]